MIKYVQHNRKFILKSYRNHLSVIATDTLYYRAVTLDTGIEFFLDDGTYLQVLPAKLNIKPLMLYGNAILTLQECAEFDYQNNIIYPDIKAGQNICYLYPVSRAYFGRIEIEQITEAQKDFINAKG